MTLLARLRALCEHSPPGMLIQLPADWLREEIAVQQEIEPPAATVVPGTPLISTWRQLLWTAPAETRIGAVELCEAFGRPKSWMYRHTSAGTIPHRKFDGELVFVVGELRAWAREREEIVQSGPMESTPLERKGLVIHRPSLRSRS